MVGNDNYDDIIRESMRLALSTPGAHGAPDVPSAQLLPGQRVLDDVNENAVDTGDEQDRPMFSDKQFDLQMAHDREESARAIQDPNNPATQQRYYDAVKTYDRLLNDPRLPVNRRNIRYTREENQGADDAQMIERAMSERAARGRR